MPLPVPLANLSLWQLTVRAHPLLSANSEAPLPASTDIVIVGGGLCGAVLAHALLHPEEHGLPVSSVPRITLLEARQLASGASGRNAGHCRPDAARGFPHFASLHGAEQARRILESEREVFNRVDVFVKRHGIECEWNARSTFDVFLSQEFAEHSAAAVDGYAAAGGYLELKSLSAESARRAFPADSYGANEWLAATLNPAQLTLAVLALCRGDNFTAFAHTPVLKVDEADQGWKVCTPRGDILAQKVVFATNAYGGHGLEELIAPLVAQAHKLPTGPHLPGSYSLRYSPDVFYSVAPRGDDSVVLGASLGSGPVVSGYDDSAWSAGIARGALMAWEGLLPGDRVKLGEDSLDDAAKVHGNKDEAMDAPGVQGLDYAWSGVIGFTPDMVPLVGDVPGKQGQFVAAGYCGHGMARIFLTAPTLAKYITTGEWDEAMPSCFRVTPERVARLQQMEMPAVVRRAQSRPQ